MLNLANRGRGDVPARLPGLGHRSRKLHLARIPWIYGFTSACWLAWSFAAYAGTQGLLTQTDVFVSGKDGYHTYRIPAIESAPDGSLIAFAEARKYNADDPGFGRQDIDLVYKRSTNNGATWAAMTVLEDPGELWSAANPATVVDRAKGRLWVFYLRSRPGRSTDTARPGTDDLQTMARWSEDNGRTWSEPLDLTAMARDLGDPAWRASVAGPGGAIQTHTGRLLVPMWKAPYGVFALFSDDHGRTWQRGRCVPGTQGGDENQVVELANGHILMDIRQNAGAHRWLAESADGGATWAEPRPGMTVTPVACAIERLTLQSAGQDRNRLLWAGPKGPDRRRLAIRTSFDEGRTFTGERVLAEDFAAYSDMAVLKDGTVGILWERGVERGYQFIAFTRVSREWLTPACSLRLDCEKTHQVFEGFGATTLSLVFEGGAGDSLGPVLRPKVIDAVYSRVKLTMGNLSVGLLESPGGWDQRQNDNDDPQLINWRGFSTTPADNMLNEVVRPALSMGFTNYSLQGNINWRWTSPWLAELYRKDRARCLEECAEQVQACVTYWQKIAGAPPRLVHLFNEPTSGNGEMNGADAEMIRDVIKHAGARLHGVGFREVRFVVPNEETVGRSIAVARVILADAEARQYVGAIGYHVYPYGSPYASVPRILKASGAGQPDELSIKERHQLRELCRTYGVPAWMTEVSHGEVDPRSMDHLRGRAIHIHDEMVHADAAAYYGMNAFWDKQSHAAHFAGRGGEAPLAYLSEQDSIVLTDNETGQVLISGMGYAIGHYARWVNRGATRIEAESSDPLVQVTAFLDRPGKRLVLVLINNAVEARTLFINGRHLAARGDVTGEQSWGQARWQAVSAFAPETLERIHTTLLPQSVTSLAVARD